MNELVKKYSKTGLTILALSEMPAQMQASFKKAVQYPLLIWEKDKLPPPLTMVKGYPTTVLIDRQGKVRKVFFGPATHALDSFVQQALKEKPPATPEKKQKA